MRRERNQGTPNHHVASALNGQPASYRVSRPMRIPAEIERENQERAFKWGLALGFAAACLIFGIILWVWVIPTMDAAVATAQGMVS